MSNFSARKMFRLKPRKPNSASNTKNSAARCPLSFAATDRPLRKEAWEVVANRRLQETDKFEEVFDKQIKLRQQIAKNAGFDNYRDYAFRRLGRFDYTLDDCVKFHDAVAKKIMPAVRYLSA